MERKYYVRCYIAFYWTLERIFLQSKEPVSPHPFSLCDLLSDMCPFTFATGISADPASYFDYEKMLKSRIKTPEDETTLNGYIAGRDYLKMYLSEYEYDLERTIKEFSLDDYSLAYEKVNTEKIQ